MQDDHEGSNRSPQREDRGDSDAQTTSDMPGTSGAFARQIDEIESLLKHHRGTLNTGGLYVQSPALDGEQEENDAGNKETSDDAVTDLERDSEQPCSENDLIDRESPFDSPAMKRGIEKTFKALEISCQKLSSLIERVCRTEDGPPYDDDSGRYLNARIKAFGKEVKKLCQEVQVFKARLKEANEIVRQISKAPCTNKVEFLAQLKEAIEKAGRVKSMMEKAAADVGDDKLHGEAQGT